MAAQWPVLSEPRLAVPSSLPPPALPSDPPPALPLQPSRAPWPSASRCASACCPPPDAPPESGDLALAAGRPAAS